MSPFLFSDRIMVVWTREGEDYSFSLRRHRAVSEGRIRQGHSSSSTVLCAGGQRVPRSAGRAPHVGGAGRRCLTGGDFTARMPVVAMRIMRPGANLFVQPVSNDRVRNAIVGRGCAAKETAVNYALLPFPTFSKEAEYAGRPDIRDALASRHRPVARNAIDNLELLDHVVESLRELPWRFAVDHCHEQDGQLHLAVMAHDLGRHLDVGDKINAGFFLQNAEDGQSETLACARAFRVTCENGALLECEEGQSFTISAAGAPPTDWGDKITGVIDRSFSGEGLDVDLARFRATTQQMVITPYELLCHLSAQGLITDDEQSDIQSAFAEAADFTMYGLINAVTRVAHGLRSNDRWVRAFQIERLGGEILRGDHHLPALEPVYSR
jgi:hypothetical protein